MQCYESEALRLQLYADAHRLRPQTVFDPLTLDEVLDEAHIEGIAQYNAIEPAQRTTLVEKVNRLSAPRPAHRHASVA
ncbi:MAG: hypothetical protein WAL83_07800 [Arenicellales bacterium]